MGGRNRRPATSVVGRLLGTPLAHRRPGYPLSGCSPAEPGSVSPGAVNVPKRPLATRPPLSRARRSGSWLAHLTAVIAGRSRPPRRQSLLNRYSTTVPVDAPHGNISPSGNTREWNRCRQVSSLKMRMGRLPAQTFSGRLHLFFQGFDYGARVRRRGLLTSSAITPSRWSETSTSVRPPQTGFQ